MAPIKFEEKLKDKLEKRSLQPSADSWSKLSDRLDKEEKQSKKPWFWWMSIAAGIIIMLAIAVQLFRTNDIQNEEPQIVKEDAAEPIIEEQQLILEKEDIKEMVAETDNLENETEEEKEKENNETRTQQQIINFKSVVKEKSKAEPQLVNTSNSIKKDIKLLDITSNSEQNDLINQPQIDKDAVVTAINQFKSENTSVTDREVDSLLKLASKELFKDKLQKEMSKTVDAKLLLQGVEEEMGQSFRTKVFEILKESYETVKTTVAERKN